MQTDNRFFDDLARVAGGALNTLTGIKAELEALMRQQFERLTADMNLVTRDEFEAVQAMAAKARAEQEAMAARLAALEAQVAELQARRAPPKPATQPVERRTTPKTARRAPRRTPPKPPGEEK